MPAAKKPKSLSELLSEIMAEVGYVQKDAENKHQNYRYASAEAVLKRVNGACSSRGICCASRAELLRWSRDEGDKPKTRAVVKLCLSFWKGEECVTVEGLGEGVDAGDKAVLKANTSALKYALANGFLISWGDDPESDISTDADAVAVPAEPTEPGSIFAGMIDQAKTGDQLIKVAESIKASKVSAVQRKQLLNMYNTKKEQING